jgi:hypothetical protein
MSPRTSQPARRPVTVALCLMALTLAIALACAATAHAADYRMVLCAANSGSDSFQTATNTTSAQSPAGIFSFENYCGPAPFPAGNNAFLRIAENQGSGNAGDGAYGSISWTVPPWIAILGGGGYTREPGSFNAGWRGRFWAEDFGGGGHHILLQGAGVENGSNEGISWATTSTFASHLWPFPVYGYYRRVIFELTCMRPSGCDRSGWNAVDANTMVLTLADVSPAQAGFTGGQVLSGGWVRGDQAFTWNTADQGSGLRFERLRLDGAQIWQGDYRGQCDIDSNGGVGEFARQFTPCPAGGPWGHSYTLGTGGIPDGAHTLQVCAQDYAQAAGLDGTGGESCDQRTIRTDNTPPGAPTGLDVVSSNPARYLDRFGARFGLPPNPGSPIVRVHYFITDAAGKAVVPERVVAATEPTALTGIEGPAHAGAYTLHVALEDQVGFVGPFAEAAIPRDTTPPAAPQNLRVAGPSTGRWNGRFDLAWHDITDDGSPIDAVHYEIVDPAGHLVGSPHTVGGEGVETLHDVEAPSRRGSYEARVWLSDEEGNVGAPASVPLPLDTTPPAAPQDLAVTPPGVSRASQGFDVSWRDVTDEGSPIVAAHYRIEDGSGDIVVPTQTVKGEDVAAIGDLEAPAQRGDYTLRIWLEDAEGNLGASATAPLAYECVRSDGSGGEALTSGLGEQEVPEQIVHQGEGSTLDGRLSGHGGGVGDASICVFSRVVTDQGREFLGIAMTGADGSYRFAIPAGASRELSAVYRSGAREVSSASTIETVVHPAFEAVKKVVYNKHYARFTGSIPGPDNNRVLVVAQVKRGKGWLAFHRYRTRADGHVDIVYRFNKTFVPTKYRMRLQVRTQSGYPYLQGDSHVLALIVRPKAAGRRRRSR